MLCKSTRIGQLKVLKVVNNAGKNGTTKSLHCGVVNLRRRGPVADVRLPELIVDKQPDYFDSIQKKLDRIDYYGNHPTLINVGCEDDSKLQQNFTELSKQMLSNLKRTAEENEDDLIEELEGKRKIMSLNDAEYDSLQRSTRFTENYQNSTINLANHFGIFRDLFFIENNHEIDRSILQQNSDDGPNPKLFEPRQKVYSFKPIVPFDVEFFMPDTEDSETMLCQSVYRGNLIPSEFGRLSPQITINTSAINSTFSASPTTSPHNSLGISLQGSDSNDTAFYTLAMVNLDSHFNDSSVCHWLVGNIHKNGDETVSEEIIKYLPVHGIRGLGYHRYCFVIFRHDAKLQLENVSDFDLGKRKFNAKEFMDDFGDNSNLIPVGISWFQTTWSENCKDVYYKFLDMRCPVYEYEHPNPNTKFVQKQYPARAPFNIYLDYFRDPKEMAKEVLSERLKGIDIRKSYDSSKMYAQWNGRPIFPHIHEIPKDTPDWLKASIIKKRSLVGRYRGLRPASAQLPYNNNADLDNPIWPRISSDVQPLNCPLPYPDGKRRPKPLRKTLWTVPIPDHHSLRIDFPQQLPDSELKEFKKTQKND